MNFEIIDFHSHPFLQECDSICVYKSTTTNAFDITPEDMKNVGISRFCGSVITKRGEGFEKEQNCNADAYKLAEIYQGKYIPGIQVNANYVDESCREIDIAKDRGIKLIGELVPYFYKWDYGQPGFRDILDHARGKINLINLHTIVQSPMEALAADYKDINFVFAHPGEKNIVEWHIDIMKKHDNVYLDISGTGIFRFGLLSRLISEVGVERILFGTDYPVCNAGVYVGGVMAERIPDKDKEMIFSKNAKRLLQL